MSLMLTSQQACGCVSILQMNIDQLDVLIQHFLYYYVTFTVQYPCKL